MKKTSYLSLCAMLALLCGACSTVPNDHFYTLIDPAPQAALKDAGQNACDSVNINAVTLPEAVDRTELVLRNVGSGGHSINVMDGQRWAESLKSAIPRAVAQNLSVRLQCPNVTVQADTASRDAKYLVWIDITRFDSVLGEAATIDALWGVRPAAGGTARKGSSHLRVAVTGGGYDNLVAAHANALALMSDEIALQIKELEKSGN